MRPVNDLWIDLVELDFRLDDGVWDGSIPPQIPLDEVPPWLEELEQLIATARGPVTADELQGEADIVAEMARLCEGMPHVGPMASAWRRARMVGAVATAKTATAVAVTAVGAAALATTTGIVVSRVLPTLGNPDREPPSVSTPYEHEGKTAGGAEYVGGDPADDLDGPGADDRCAVVQLVVETECRTDGSADSSDSRGDRPTAEDDGGDVDGTGDATDGDGIAATTDETNDVAAGITTDTTDTTDQVAPAPAPDGSGTGTDTPPPPDGGDTGGATPGNSGSTPGESGSAPGRMQPAPDDAGDGSGAGGPGTPGVSPFAQGGDAPGLTGSAAPSGSLPSQTGSAAAPGGAGASEAGLGAGRSGSG